MSLQWTIVATFLYAEMAVCILLMLPFISPTRWRSLFKSRLFHALTSYGNIYFSIFIAILIILFIDGVRDVMRYSQPLTTEDRNNPTAEINLHMKLFRSQRNFYIAGFALFLSLILRRLVTLISSQGALQADCDAAKRQAESATAAAQKFMDEMDNKPKQASEENEQNNMKKQMDQAQEEIETLRDELTHKEIDMETMKKQAESTNKEYDRLNAELASLQKELKDRVGGSESKKDE